ncbi:uncharacterized protein MELLADRAFT_58381 [Melampsora larici-populina 98AG31]|uniref:Secreted protein n=1 Tax=Melampsora larici-populina (strain 98AG31 / pathotype 3-4-7) TaxID=747676 RepID=F4R3B3_MELLP|nr:uncharacterized protein MELLADRAFT_58381 [Melampsora larici-populina 98AG31]EGG13198.1 hypothetical protein MELLADRAFT_58381 [Melampsora larici-populina 98AG31]
MQLSIHFYVFLIQISSSSAISPTCTPTAQRPHIFDLNENIVQTETPQQAVDDDGNFVTHGFYSSSSNQQPQIGIDRHISHDDYMNSWRSNLQREDYNNFISSSTRQPSSRIIETISPEHLMESSWLHTTPVVRVDKDRDLESKQRIHASSSDSSQEESFPPSSSPETDQSESGAMITAQNSIGSRQSITGPLFRKSHSRDSMSRNRIKRPAHEIDDQFRPSSSTPHPYVGVNNEISPPQARDLRRLTNEQVAQIDDNRDIGFRLGTEQRSHNTVDESLPALSTQNHQIQGDKASVLPHPIGSYWSDPEVLAQRADITSSVVDIPEDSAVAREVNEKEPYCL